MITINEISEQLDMPVNEIMDILETEGVFVWDENTEVSEDILRNIKTKYNFQPEHSEQDERYEGLLKNYAENFKIFIDTCSLMNPKFKDVYTSFLPYMRAAGNKFIIPKSVINEINRLQHHDSDETKKSAMRAAKMVTKMNEEGLIEVRGESTDRLADNVFQTVFTKFRMDHNLMLITQDHNLGREIRALDNSQAVRTDKKILVKRINGGGRIMNFTVPQRNFSKSSSIPENERFEQGKQVVKFEDNLLPVRYVPGEGDTVFMGNGESVVLKNVLGDGGEGTVYLSDRGMAVKIYKKEKLTKEKCQKIKLMLSKDIRCEGVCWPTNIIYNNHREFVGYEMPLAKGKPLQTAIFTKPLFLRGYPDWKKSNMVGLCLDILNKIIYLHDRNIILGDINPHNILIDEQGKTVFVDTDSYQVGGFPCPVGTIPFKAQELFIEDREFKEKYGRSRSFGEYLRTFNNEYFAIAVLLFEIMLPGKHPYSLLGGSDMEENILRMDFAYPLGDQSNGKTPGGPWRFAWSHLPYKVKKSFYETFRKEGEYTGKNRLTPREWRNLFKKYKELLDNGKMREQDPMSEEIYPTRFKHLRGFEYIKCKLCSEEVLADGLKQGICHRCLKDGEEYNCKKCGKPLFYSNYRRYIENKSKIDTCPECHEKGKMVYKKKTCRSCGKDFEITNNDAEYFRNKGHQLPERCPECRKKNNTATGTHNTYTVTRPTSASRTTTRPAGTTTTRPTTTRPAPHNSKGFCYITTAVCEAFGKPDDCYELTKLREFRDYRLVAMDGGRELIDEYYRTAPELVRRIEARPDRKKIYEILLHDYIEPCINMIEYGLYESCRHKYVEMVNYVKALVGYADINE